VDRLHVLPELGELLRRQRPDEVLLAQEVEVGDEPSVLAAAPPVAERRVALPIVDQQETDVAARTAEKVGQRRPAVRLGADQLEEVKRRSGRKAQTLEMIEPEDLASRADVNLDRRAEMSVKRLRVHLGRARGAAHEISDFRGQIAD